MRPRTIALRFALALPAMALLAACGGKQGAAEVPATSTAGGIDAGPEAAAAAPVVHPFASTPVEAQTLIQDQIDAHMKTLWACATDYRAKKGDPHKAVVVDVGIDQEGTLLGVMSPNPKQDLDPALRDCIFGTLHGLPFPRSHAGVITVRQSFTDAAISR
jgi:hypothetical protein